VRSTIFRHSPKQTAAEGHTRRERTKKFMTLFIKGKEKRVPRPLMLGGMPVDASIAYNAGSARRESSGAAVASD